jgi:hypothetical protein
MLGVLIVFEVISGHWHTPNGHHDSNAIGRRIAWAANGQSKRTVVIALRASCKFCAASMPFYSRLLSMAQERKNLQIVAVMESSVEDSNKYLHSKAILFSAVRQDSLETLGVDGTPAILVLDGRGVVRHSWLGLLNKDAERDAAKEIMEDL